MLVTTFISQSPPSEQAWIPVKKGPYRIRGIYPGRLEELEAAFRRGVRPRPTLAVGYARTSDACINSPWDQLIPLRRRSGQALHLTYSVPIVEAVRQAVMQHLPDDAPGVLTGHDADGSSLRSGHLAIVPLPRVGDRFADGEVLGVGLLLPRGLSNSHFGDLIGALGRWLEAGGYVEIGRIRWQMEVAHDDHRFSLRGSRFTGPAEMWASVTPVVFDRHPRRDLKLAQIVDAMCRDVGLPAPECVEVAPYGIWKGTAESRRHALGGRG